jgi:mono/diheme cytochrome c family protein
LSTDPTNVKDEWLWQSLSNAGKGAVKKGAATFGVELISNGSFENTAGDMPTGWAARSYGGVAKHRVANIARTGKHSIEISSAKGADSSVHFDLKVDSNSEYELSGWIKTENVVGGGHGALLALHALPGKPRSKSVKGTHDWTQVKLRFETGSAKSISMNCLFGGWGTSTGKAWWDDVSLRKVTYESLADDQPELAVGDIARGKNIFMTHPIAACTRCHIVNGVGGPIGPALDTIATRKQEDYILQSLVDPGATIAEGFVGQVSPMPPMGVLLKPQELADVMAYILTLK